MLLNHNGRVKNTRAMPPLPPLRNEPYVMLNDLSMEKMNGFLVHLEVNQGFELLRWRNLNFKNDDDKI